MPKASTATGVSFVTRATKAKTKTAANALLRAYEAGEFPATNPKTLRRQRRAAAALRAYLKARFKS